MKHQFSQSTLATFFTLCLFSVSQPALKAAPGNLGQIPLFVAAPVQPNIFFMLDDSGSMGWNLRATSGGSITFAAYDITPDFDEEWRTWCLGANALAYNSAISYRPWAGNRPGTTTPYPDQDFTKAWSEPTSVGDLQSTDDPVANSNTRKYDLSNAPVVTWTDGFGVNGVIIEAPDGIYDSGECAVTFSDSRVKKVKDLATDAEKTNFANWFTYYRDRDRTVTAAVSQVVANSSARMGMATLHFNNNVGKAVKDMNVLANKNDLLNDIAKIRPGGGTPLRTRLDWVGEYFDKSSNTPSELNIGSVSSPILDVAHGGECQQNFAMMMSDGFRNGTDAGVGHQDKLRDIPFVYRAHLDNVSDTLADVAMKWYKTDLDTNLANKVPVQTGDNTQNLDENNQQHLVTFTVAFGLSDTFTNPVDRTSRFTWSPAGATSDALKLIDLRHAAYNGRGQYLSAGNPDSLSASLQNVISDIESRKGSGSAVSFNSSTLLAGSSLYFASFDTVGWIGDVRSFSVNPATGRLIQPAQWSAADKLNLKTNGEMAARTVYTWGVEDASGTNNGVLFDWNISVPTPASTILADFKINSDLTTDTSPFSASQRRLNFVRGDTSNDGVGLIRERTSRLGDMVHSATQFVGKPVSNWPDTGSFGIDGNRYSLYESSTSRDEVVYVGANDGLLHGFSASTGQEVLAYLPSAPASVIDSQGLHYLTESDYQHRYYVDGSPVSTDVYMPIEPLGTKDWRTILIGALGGGGQGLYALDVTNPAQFANTQTAAKNTVLWEFTNQDDDHLGFSFSTPQVTMMNNGEWAVIIGNGYNATGTDTAELKIIFIEKGLDGEWATAGDYITVDTRKGTAAEKNGLSTPTLVDLDENGTTDRIYAGDLLGNMWAFDVSNATASNWGSAYNVLTDPAPLFTALDSGVAQPITMKPLIVKPEADWVEDDGNNAPNIMVYFGTGQFVATGDAVNTNQQSFYGVWDAGGVVAKSKLIEQTPISGVPADARVFTQNPVTLAPNIELGWYIDLPETGERVVVNAFEFLGLIYFNTMTPSTSPCSAGGTSWLMALNMKSGANPTSAAFDVDADGSFNDSDQVSDGSTDHHVAGVKFELGIASATAVMTNQDGKSFAYTSGTGTGAGDGSGSIPLDIRDLPSGPTAATGARRAWIQLFN